MPRETRYTAPDFDPGLVKKALAKRLDMHGALRDYEELVASPETLRALAADYKGQPRLKVPGYSLVWGSDSPPLSHLMPPQTGVADGRHNAGYAAIPAALETGDWSLVKRSLASWRGGVFRRFAEPTPKELLMAMVCTRASHKAEVNVHEGGASFVELRRCAARPIIDIEEEGVRWGDKWLEMPGAIRWEMFKPRTRDGIVPRELQAFKLNMFLPDDPYLDLLLLLRAESGDGLSVSDRRKNHILTANLDEAPPQPIGLKHVYDVTRMAEPRSLLDYDFQGLPTDEVEVNILSLFNYYVVKTGVASPEFFRSIVNGQKAIRNHQARVVTIKLRTLRRWISNIHDTHGPGW